MNGQRPPPQEFIGYRRAAALPGIEVLDAHHSPRQWRCVNDSFALTFLRTWHGDVSYRGVKHAARPGLIVCNQPGEALLAAPHAGVAGSFNVLELRRELFEEYMRAHQTRAVRFEWRAVVPAISDAFSLQMRRLLAAMDPSTPPLELQSEAIELSHFLVRELVTADVVAPARASAGLFRVAARMRECLHEEGFQLDLDTLAQRAGISKFHALRAFKRRYGLAPHAYQLCVRVKRASQLLAAGASPAEAAAACGFSDQSHMNRHFKRIVGITPKQYQLARGTNQEESPSSAAWRDPAAPVDRSDWRVH
ncbi:MAG TPA: AraC family transcriptional regulator [Polyangiaceae bacterium]|jgi:AraC-like DNA-binding protein|nr:AraC family transcriptional regulator [Polyangiaceae bacterium]